MERTTDLTELQGGANFTWGKIVRFHHITEYDIVEYNPWKTDGVTLLAGQPSEALEYSCYVDGHSISRSTNSFDAALVTCIAAKRDGNNSQAALYFMKMVG